MYFLEVVSSMHNSYTQHSVQCHNKATINNIATSATMVVMLIKNTLAVFSEPLQIRSKTHPAKFSERVWFETLRILRLQHHAWKCELFF